MFVFFCISGISKAKSQNDIEMKANSISDVPEKVGNRTDVTGE